MTEAQYPEAFEAGGEQAVEAADRQTGGVETPPDGADVPATDEDTPGPAQPEDTFEAPERGVQLPGAEATPTEPVPEPPEVDISMPAPPETGESRVDQAVSPLGRLGDRPTEEHVSAYDDAHTGLQDVLADLDRDSDGP